MDLSPNPFNGIAALVSRVEALERAGLGLMSRPPSGTPDGSVATSDTSQTGGVAWERSGQAGYGETTTNQTGATIYDVCSFSITGDGVTPVKFEAMIGAVRATGAGQNIMASIRNSTDAEFIARSYQHSPGANYNMSFALYGVYPAWTGSKTFHIRLFNFSSVNFVADAAPGSGVNPISLRAIWSPGLSETVA